jgi:hypothetical protein
MTFLLLALTLLLIRARRLLLLPLVFLVWANLHGGVGLGGLTLIAATLAASLTEPRTLPRWIGVTLLSTAATLINPLGLGMWSFTLSKLTTAEALYIDEWLPPALDRPVSYPFFILVAAWAGALLLRWRAIFRRDDPERHFWVTALLIGAIYAVMGFRSIRHTPLFAVAALPLLLHPHVWPVPRAPAAQGGWQRGLLHLVLIGLVVGGGALGVAATWAQAQNTAWRPLAPPVVTAVQSCRGTLYNTFDMGGALLWFVPERPVFVDSRNDPYPTDLLFRAVIAEQHGTYDELFAQYDVRCALVPTRQKIYAALRADPAWTELYSNDKLAVFARLNSG